MPDDQSPLEPGERNLLLAGLGVVGGGAALGVVISALLGGDGLVGVLIGAGVGVIVSICVFAVGVYRRL